MAVPLVILVIALTGAYAGFTSFTQNLTFTRAETEVSFWGREGYQPLTTTIKRTGHGIESLLQNAPNHPQYLGLQATYFAWRGYWEDNNMDNRASFNTQAVQSQYQGLQSRPAHRHSWLKLLEYASRSSSGEAMAIEAQDRLQALSLKTEL
jgi:hypothetical protein